MLFESCVTFSQMPESFLCTQFNDFRQSQVCGGYIGRSRGESTSKNVVMEGSVGRN